MSNTVGSEWHEGCGEFMEHQDVRADPHGSSVGGGGTEDGGAGCS
jgi:hypothetical protein